MYGHLYYEDKLKPLVDRAHAVACEEAKRMNIEAPIRMTSWGVVARAEYVKESEEVKKQVANAVEAEVIRVKLLEDGQPVEEDADKRLLAIEAYVILKFEINYNYSLSALRTIEVLPRTFRKLVDVVERRTGYPMVILWGGPQPKENGVIGTFQCV